jgi:hypothetical protein
VEIAPNQIALRKLPVGARILIRTKKDWRAAAISSFTEEKATLIVCSPSGRTYRLFRSLETILFFEGKIPLLRIENEEDWRQNFTKYDLRW